MRRIKGALNLFRGYSRFILRSLFLGWPGRLASVLNLIRGYWWFILRGLVLCGLSVVVIAACVRTGQTEFTYKGALRSVETIGFEAVSSEQRAGMQIVTTSIELEVATNEARLGFRPRIRPFVVNLNISQEMGAQMGLSFRPADAVPEVHAKRMTVKMEGQLEAVMPLHGTEAKIEFLHGAHEDNGQLATLISLKKPAERELTSAGDMWVQPLGSSESKMVVEMEMFARLPQRAASIPAETENMAEMEMFAQMSEGAFPIFTETLNIEGSAPPRGRGMFVTVYLWGSAPSNDLWDSIWTPSQELQEETFFGLFDPPGVWGFDADVSLDIKETQSINLFATKGLILNAGATGAFVLSGGMEKEIPLGFSADNFQIGFRRVAISAINDGLTGIIDWTGEVTEIKNRDNGEILASIKEWDVLPNFLKSFLLGSIGILLFDIVQGAARHFWGPPRFQRENSDRLH